MTVRLNVDPVAEVLYALREGEQYTTSREGDSGAVVFRVNATGAIVGAILIGAVGAPRAIWEALAERSQLPDDVRAALDDWFDLSPGQRLAQPAVLRAPLLRNG